MTIRNTGQRLHRAAPITSVDVKTSARLMMTMRFTPWGKVLVRSLEDARMQLRRDFVATPTTVQRFDQFAIARAQALAHAAKPAN